MVKLASFILVLFDDIEVGEGGIRICPFFFQPTYQVWIRMLPKSLQDHGMQMKTHSFFK